MKGWYTIKSFYHNRLHLAKEKVDPKEINPIWYDQLEAQGLIKYVERPEIMMPKKVTKKKKNVRSRKRNV
jgi:hypothetical protein